MGRRLATLAGLVGVALLGTLVNVTRGGSPEAFVNGMHRALLVAAGVLVAGALTTLAFVRPQRQEIPAETALVAAG